MRWSYKPKVTYNEYECIHYLEVFMIFFQFSISKKLRYRMLNSASYFELLTLLIKKLESLCLKWTSILSGNCYRVAMFYRIYKTFTVHSQVQKH